LQRVLDDGDNTLKLFRGEVTGTLAEINIGLLADQVGVAATDTLDLGQGVHDLLLSIDVRVQQTDDVLEARSRQHCKSMISEHHRCVLPASQSPQAIQYPASVVSITSPEACCAENVTTLRMISSFKAHDRLSRGHRRLSEHASGIEVRIET
jgi:hypothetical protein